MSCFRRTSVVLLVLLLLACRRVTIEPPPSLVLSGGGSDSAGPLLAGLSAAFVADRPHLSFEFEAGNSSQALNRLLAGELDFVLTAQEHPELSQLRQTAIARDGLAIIVHPDNPVENLTLLDLERLFGGVIYDWRDVQTPLGARGPVQVVTREGDAGITHFFQTRILPDGRITPNARVFPNSQAVVEFVAQTPEAVAFVGTPHLNPEVKVVTVEEIFPASETLTNAAYPLTYPLYLVALPRRDGLWREFTNFVLSPAGQALVAGRGLGRVR